MINNTNWQELNLRIRKLNDFFYDNCYTIVYGIARACLAIGLLITFLFSTNEILFDKDLFQYGTINSIVDNINLFFLLGYENIWIGEIISIIVLLLVISGFFPRITGVLHWWVVFSFNNAGSIVDGGDQIAGVLLFFLIPITLLDNRLNHYAAPTKQNLFSRYISNVFLKVLIPIQMSVLYFHAVTEKLYKVEEWRNGTAVYYFSKDPLFGTEILDNFEVLSFTFFATLFTWGTLLLEFVFAGALFMNYKTKKWILPFAIFFHFCIALMFGLTSFMFGMLGGLIIYLLNPNGIQFSTSQKAQKSTAFISGIDNALYGKLSGVIAFFILSVIIWFDFNRNIMSLSDIVFLIFITISFIAFVNSKILFKWAKNIFYRTNKNTSIINLNQINQSE